jgi:hypothetical protein
MEEYRWIYILRTCELILAKGQELKVGQVSDPCWNLACITHNFTRSIAGSTLYAPVN